MPGSKGAKLCIFVKFCRASLGKWSLKVHATVPVNIWAIEEAFCFWHLICRFHNVFVKFTRDLFIGRVPPPPRELFLISDSDLFFKICKKSCNCFQNYLRRLFGGSWFQWQTKGVLCRFMAGISSINCLLLKPRPYLYNAQWQLTVAKIKTTSCMIQNDVYTYNSLRSFKQFL